MYDEDEVEKEPRVDGDEEEMGIPPEGMTDFGLDEEDPDKDR